ncbi:MAG: hypothetical protein K2X82_17705 [Gemmataceae bacterium]|nr:hypothetical protein [Gemmataceae bacterium]
MIYEHPEPDAPLTQGDIITGCPLVFWRHDPGQPDPRSVQSTATVVVLTQACDLAQAKAGRTLAAVVHQVRFLVDSGLLKAATIRDQVRAHRVYGWYFLPAGPGVDESLVDLRDLHTLPRSLLEQLIRAGHRTARIATPYREHLAQHFTTTYARIALPEPYPTDPDI